MTHYLRLEAYEKMKASGVLSARRLHVYYALAYNVPPMCSACVWTFLKANGYKMPQHSINPRFVELEHNKLIERIGEHVCPITTYTTATWAPTGKVITEWKKIPPRHTPGHVHDFERCSGCRAIYNRGRVDAVGQRTLF